jgi:hypothetical protein
VGVYRTDSGERGGFLLILTADQRGRWAKRALFKNPEGRFSALLQKSGRLVWTFCFECDGTCNVLPRRGAWKLDCQEP